MKKLPYLEGDFFLVPLMEDGYALGLIARKAGRSGILLGYFFDTVYRAIPFYRKMGFGDILRWKKGSVHY